MKSKRVLVFLLAMCVLIMSFPMSTLAKQGSDVKGHWSEKVFNEMESKGYINLAENEDFHPNNHITRGEFVTMFNHAVSSTLIKSVDVSQYKELDWFDKYVKSLIEQDTLEGDLSELVSNPKQIVAREEVVVIAAMILGIDVQDKMRFLNGLKAGLLLW